MITDPVADLLTHIRNACIAGHPSLTTPGSKLKGLVLKVLEEEGYIDSYEDAEVDGKPALKIFLKYERSGKPVIRELRRVSRPGKRMYVRHDSIPREKNGLGTLIVSTSQGVMADKDARKRGVGGEPLCAVF